MKKIGIITFHQSNNFGALLQNYALHTVLKQMGHKPETISYKSEYIGKPYRLLNLRKKGLKDYLFGVAGFLCYLPRTKNSNRFRRYIQFSRPVDKTDLPGLNEEYDLFITGSDQVWNYRLTNRDSAYLLDFVQDNHKIYSYAASVGVSEIDSDCREMYERLLRRFAGISLREKNSVAMIEQLAGKEAQVVLDPTLLLDATQWEKIAVRKKRAPYVLVYQLGISSELLIYAKEMAKRLGCGVECIPFPMGKMLRCGFNVSIGPAEWLGLFRDAAYIVTDSYHGTAFSILFHKQFRVRVGGTHSGVSSRIYGLLETVGLEDCILNGTTYDGKNIAYDEVDIRLERERKKSRAYLRKILGDSIEKEEL